MKLFIIYFILYLFNLNYLSSNEYEADYYVCNKGSDSWSGTLPQANADKSNGPFATIKRAQLAVRRKLKESPQQNIKVLIRGGDYYFNKTLVFNIEDSSNKIKTMYEAYPNEKPKLSSAIKVKEWKKLTNNDLNFPERSLSNLWVADLSLLKEIPLPFHALYDDLGRLNRARSKGFIPEIPSNYKDKTERNVIHFPKGVLKKWNNLTDIEIIVRPLHAWITNILGLKSINLRSQTAQTAIAPTYPMLPLKYLKEKNSCWVENVAEGLDQPGEWVLDTKEKKLYLWPRDNQKPNSIYIPCLLELIRVEGQVRHDKTSDTPLKNLYFKGLTFQHGMRYSFSEKAKGLQHDWELYDEATAMLRLRATENCVIDHCHFINSGGAAIRLDLHAINNSIENNVIEHIGGTGILLCGYGPGTKNVNKNNVVSNNHIHHTGEIYSHSPGIFIWQSGENRVTHNLIHDTPYSGIIISGVMDDFFNGFRKRELYPTIRWHEIEHNRKSPMNHSMIKPYLHTRNNIISNNEIRHVMQELADGNGIYIRGAGPGNIIQNNYIHHLLAPTIMQSAIRTDGGQRDTLIKNNLIYKCTGQGIQVKLNNRAEYNIIANLIEGKHKGKFYPPTYLKLREGPLTGGVYKRNIFYHTGKRVIFVDQGKNPRLPSAWLKDAESDYNLYYCKGNPQLSKKHLEKSKLEGTDLHSLALDPEFIDPDNGNFDLKPNSPLKKQGFFPLNMSTIGRLHE